jgi:CRP-like cAMP-binding protein
MMTRNAADSRTLSADDKKRIRKLLEHECDYIMPEKIADEFLDAGEIIEVKKWDNVISSGDMNPDIYVVIEGILRCWYWDDDREITAFFSTLPTMAINYHTYYANKPSFYNFQACTPAKLLHIKKEIFDSLVERLPEFARWNLRVAQNQLYYLELKRDLNQGKAKDKYLSLVRELPDIMNSVPLQIVASYLGITPQHLSRLRRSLL